MDATDTELARRIRGRQPDAKAAEAELFRRFAGRIRLYGLRHLYAEAAAEDLVQQVLVIVIESLRAGKVRDTEQLASFVLGTARLVARGLRRGELRRQQLLDQFAPGEAPGAEQASGLDLERLRGCLERLPPRERTIVMLTFYADKSGDEIGAELGMTPVNVRVARHRAVGRMQQCMGSAEVRP
jgi:RNA polymerase sigma-70 factor (ECF subfamily)